jgi:hypothetical protein
MKYLVSVLCQTCDFKCVSQPTEKSRLRIVAVPLEMRLRAHLSANKGHQGLMPGPQKVK